MVRGFSRSKYCNIWRDSYEFESRLQALYISFHFLDTSLKYCRGSTGLVSVCDNALEKNGEQRKECVYAAFVPAASRICTAALVCRLILHVVAVQRVVFSSKDWYLCYHTLGCTTKCDDVFSLRTDLQYVFVSWLSVLHSVIWHARNNTNLLLEKQKSRCQQLTFDAINKGSYKFL